MDTMFLTHGYMMSHIYLVMNLHVYGIKFKNRIYLSKNNLFLDKKHLNIFKTIYYYILIMEISKDDYTKILNMIRSLIKDLSYEFEARICSKNFSESANMDYYKFENILNNLIFSKEKGGYGFTNYQLETTLDIKVNDYRLSILDKDSVKLYWLKGELSDDIKYKFIQKKNNSKIDLDEYNVRLSLSKEDKLDNKKISEIINLLNNDKINKTYRLKNRYLIETPDKMFRFDLTSIKMTNSTSFKKSNVFKQNVKYEVELEYIGGKHDEKSIFEQLFKNINILLTLYYDNQVLITNN